jgi:chromosome segregation ATPase
MSEQKEVVLPPIEDTFGMGAVPVADALRQRTNQLRTALGQLAALTEKVEEWKHSNLANWWSDHPRPADFDMNAYALALEHRVRWLECGISAGREDRNGFRDRAEKAEADNESLTARVEELTGELTHWRQECAAYVQTAKRLNEEVKSTNTVLAALREEINAR